ncbi:hypothetical protein DNTS_032372, partial [Danionella cerebrum]
MGSTKSKAPPPPPVQKDLSPLPHPGMEQDLTLTVVLPGGAERTTIVNGSKPMMDLLVMLCAQHHLNPSGHTIELITANRNQVKFKPNALIGGLEAQKILLKPRGMEETSKRIGPQMPEATVRLVINYKKTQKTILRVSPRVPLKDLVPAICKKCEFDEQTTVLLRNLHSEDSLDLSCSLNDFGLREVYAKDTKVISPVSPRSPVSLPPSPIHSDIIYREKETFQREKDGKRRFSLFRRGSKKNYDHSTTVSAPASPVHRKQRPVSMSFLSTHSPAMYDCNTMPSDTPKKRRAPLPPGMMSQSMPGDLSQSRSNSQSSVHPEGNQSTASLSQRSSTESCLKRSSTKRKAPPPPVVTSPPLELTLDSSTAEPVLASPLEEIKEQEEIVLTAENLLEDKHHDSSLNMFADVSLDSGRAGTAAPSQDSDILESGVVPENPTCDPSTDAEFGESTVNGEIEEGETCSSLVPSEKKDPLVGSTEESIEPPESATVQEESATSSLQLLEMSECSIETFHADCFDSELSPKSSDLVHCEDQTEEPILSSVSFAHNETEAQKPSTEPVFDVCTEPSTTSKGLRKDMATSTDELQPLSPAIQPSKELASSPPSKPKPKPSNEVSREYIPKVGMTTYTVVPQKSLEKLRFFQVELTLEPKVNCEPTATDDRVTPNGHQEVFVQTSPCTSPSKTIPSPLEETNDSVFVKEKKVPPVTRPKPASFRMTQHKRTTGDYVSSAAIRRSSFGSSSSSSSCCSSPVTRPKDSLCSSQSDNPPSLDPPLPPPPPVQLGDGGIPKVNDKPVYPNAQSEKPGPESPRFPPSLSLPHQPSLPTKPPPSLSLEKLRSFAAPKPYSPSSPSRFAQAVSSA